MVRSSRDALPRIIDTHLHIWDLERVHYPWLGPQFGILHRTYGAADVEPALAPSGVGACVLVQAANEPADTSLMLEAWDRFPWIAGVVGWVPLADPRAAAEVRAAWEGDLRALAAHPQIVAKLSGLGTALGKGAGWGPDDVRALFEQVIAWFGPERVMVGGDWPVCLLAGTYEHAMETYRALVAALPRADQEAILHGNARRFYGLARSEAPA